MLLWIFGGVKQNILHLHSPDRAAGYLELEKARVRWFLSIDAKTLPDAAKSSGKSIYRSITVDGEALEFSEGFTDLHTESYRQILAGNGYGLEAARGSLEVVYNVRHQDQVGLEGNYHPFASLPLELYPYGK
jgi:UDP-N-acetyl-2-amino-2-deoxyglucuronate dehydrogenase